MNYKIVGFLRGAGAVAGVAILHYMGTTSSWEFLANPWLAGLIVSVVGAFELSIEQNKGTALFGAVKV